ncbi:MAG: ribbon-helix-helix protein, CopG family [Alphaproteobacteria bacterium]|jgi:RHH-type transcriptional regulator, rel operon repressor / antitoxin RelB|nr:ribbon-helix-helix protein, CopG family [Alphaproteobacteria bacterium]MBT5390399.1 ribbon-helix-helix protein, CopG family [Alphaproteobacteria bacterium]
MLTVRLPKAMEEKLAHLAQDSHRSKSYYVVEALCQYLSAHENELFTIVQLMRQDKTLTFSQAREKLNL